MNDSKADIGILFLCGVFAKENEAEIVSQSKKPVEFSANQAQLKFIGGLKELADVRVVSAPFIGAYPNHSRTVRFSGFEKPQDLCEYVRFNNIWGFRNISRTCALKKAVRFFAKEKRKNKIIVVYSVHNPFLAAAEYAKKLDPSIKICLIAPDLPQYMNLEAKRGFAYDFFKKIDNKSIEKHIKSVDSTVVLTKPMIHALKADDRPYTVVEGVVDSITPAVASEKQPTKDIVYAGKLYEKFGIKTLIDAFTKLHGDEYRLILCGNGDALSYAKECAKTDNRIVLTGQISPDEVKNYLHNAAVLVNPRQNNEEYTKYSFPSKNIEYLMTGKPVVAYMLDGMPDCYADFIYATDQSIEPVSALTVALQKALNATPEEASTRYTKFITYAKKQLSASSVAEKIVSLSLGGDI